MYLISVYFDFVPFSATVEEIGLAKVNPHEDVVRYTMHHQLRQQVNGGYEMVDIPQGVCYLANGIPFH